MKRLIFLSLAFILAFQAQARNPHHKLRVVLENEVSNTQAGEALVYRMRPILNRAPLLFHCLDSSCFEETRYRYDSSLGSEVISVNGHLVASPFPFLGWMVYRAVFRASVKEDLRRQFGVQQVPQVRELEYLVAKRGAQYLKDREAEIGSLSRNDDYYYHPKFDYARRRELSLLGSLQAYERGSYYLEAHVDKRLRNVLGDLPSAQEFIQQTSNEAMKKAAKEILERYRK